MTTTEEILGPADPEQSPVISLPAPKDRKLRGKIAELPKSQRDQVNRLLEDGATYKHVSEIMLAEHQVDLNAVNLHNWFNSGFQDYTRAQERLAELSLLREGASDLMQDHDILSFHKAVNQLAVGQIFKTLMDDTLKDDPTNRTRTMNALSRLSREALIFKKYEDALAKEQPDLASKAGGTDSPSKEELDRQLLDKSDDFFGLKSPARLQAEWQAAASAQSSSNPLSDDRSAGLSADGRWQMADGRRWNVAG